MKTIRIFISSPGDVAEERKRAQEVIYGLQGRYAGRFKLVPILWEELPLQADMSFQQGIDMVMTGEGGIDIAIFIVWSRLGSPLGPRIRKADGSEYLSGTEREFDLILQARQRSQEPFRPAILFYVRKDDEGFIKRQSGQRTTQMEQMIQQRKLVETFIAEQFNDSNTGTNTRAYHSFDKPFSFFHRLRTHLRGLLDEMLAKDETSSASWDITEKGSPFRGLEAFEVEHTNIFFGREQEICNVQARLRKQSERGCAFVVIIGSSGSGKSSLARAGVIPFIAGHGNDVDSAAWRVGIFTPSKAGGDLLQGLSRIICDALPEIGTTPQEISDLAQGLKSENPAIVINLTIRKALHTAGAGSERPAKLLLLIDQLEELFTLDEINGQRGVFIRALDTLARSKGIWILATLRSDFYSYFQKESFLVALKGDRGAVDLLAPNRENVHRIITAPASLAGLRFERREDGTRLDSALLDSAMESPEALPLLEFALQDLLRRQENRGDKVLRWKDYEEMGGLEGAIATKARQALEDALAQYSPEERERCFASVFGKLISLSVADDETPIKRNAIFDELILAAPKIDSKGGKFELPGARKLVEQFIEARLLISREVKGRRVVTVAHEALLRHWEPLITLRKSKREYLRIVAQIAQSQVTWNRTGEEPSFLLPEGLPLEQGRKLLMQASDLVAEELKRYIELSLQQNKSKQRRKWMQAYSAASLIILILGYIIFIKTKHIWDQERMRAKLEMERANSLLDSEKAHEALAYFGHMMHTSNESMGAARLLFLVSQRNFALPASPPLVHSNWVWSARFTPDGSKVVTASADGTARVWNTTNGQQLGITLTHEKNVTHATFSPDGLKVVSTSEDGTAKIQGLFSGAHYEPLHHEGEVFWAEFSAGGTKLATGSADNHARIWEVNSNTISLKHAIKHPAKVVTTIFNRDGTQLLTASKDGNAYLWNVENTNLIGKLVGNGYSLYSAQFSPDEQFIATTSDNGVVQLWNTTNMTLFASFTNMSSALWSEFSPDCSFVATASADRTARMFQIHSRNMINKLEHGDMVRRVAFNGLGSQLATASDDFFARIFDTKTGKKVVEPIEHGGEVWHVEFSPDGKLLATASLDRTAKLWHVKDRTIGARKLVQVQPKTLAHFIKDRHVISFLNPLGYCSTIDPHTAETNAFSTIAKSQNGSIALIQTNTQYHVISTNKHASPLFSFSASERTIFEFSPNGRFLVSRSKEHLKVMNIEAKKTIYENKGFPVLIDFDGPEETIYLAKNNGRETSFLLVSANGDVSDPQFYHRDPVTAFKISPDGFIMATASRDSIVRFWNLKRGAKKLMPFLRANPEYSIFGRFNNIGSINSLNFTTDGSWLVTASDDGTARIWDVNSGYPICEAFRHDGKVEHAELSSDRRHLLTLAGGYVFHWELPPSLPPYPPWLSEAAETIAGIKIDGEGNRHQVPEENFFKLRDRLKKEDQNDPYVIWMRRLLP